MPDEHSTWDDVAILRLRPAVEFGCHPNGWDVMKRSLASSLHSRSQLLMKDWVMNEDELKGGVRYVKGKIEKGVGDAVDSTPWQADGIVDQIAGGAQNLYGRAKEKVKDVIDDAPDALADAGDKVRDYAQQGRTVATEQAKRNPVALIAAAGVIGYALSWLVHGKRA
ncbi:CsbD family protein [Sphingomonas sp. GB1N7]|uniref:CsbD family protein n=1 Tax=Parasphingomonas caseinilytica TaxID=3096158 RepID=UPI002FC6290E